MLTRFLRSCVPPNSVLAPLHKSKNALTKSNVAWLLSSFVQMTIEMSVPQRYLLPVEAYLCTEELMQKRMSLVVFFLERR